METEARLKYSLAIVLSLFLTFDSALVWLAAHSQPLIVSQGTIPIGIKWLMLFGVALMSIGIAFWAHRAFLEGGVSPVDTTWVDLIIIANAVLTVIALLFVEESFWVLFAIFLLLLFLFSAFVLRKLLNGARSWVVWLIATILLCLLVVILISTFLPAE